MPAPAVIPVPVAYSNVVAFKTLVSRIRTEFTCRACDLLWPTAWFGSGAGRWPAFLVGKVSHISLLLGSPRVARACTARVPA